MEHTTEIVNAHQPADGLLAVAVRCCRDPKTDSVLTLHQLERSDEEIKQDIRDHQARVAKLHAAKLRAKELVETLRGAGAAPLA